MAKQPTIERSALYLISGSSLKRLLDISMDLQKGAPNQNERYFYAGIIQSIALDAADHSAEIKPWSLSSSPAVRTSSKGRRARDAEVPSAMRPVETALPALASAIEKELSRSVPSDAPTVEELDGLRPGPAFRPPTSEKNS